MVNPTPIWIFPLIKMPAGADFTRQNWIKEPWNDPAVKASNPDLYNMKAMVHLNTTPPYFLVLRLWRRKRHNGYTICEKAGRILGGDRAVCTHIKPPTQYAWGIGRMWHWKNGQLWYVTVPYICQSLNPAYT
jgi:hypothetical protein